MVKTVSHPPFPNWLTPLYPFRPREHVTPRGARMSYVDAGGEGDEAVLMLHGNPTWSFYYRELIQAISPHRRCIAPDHIGMGLSEKPQDYDYTLATRIDDIVELVRALGLQEVDLVVHDWGGAIGFGVAARLPELIRRIVILNTGAFPLDHIPARIALCRAPVIGRPLVRGLNGFAWPATWMAMSRRALSPDEQRGYLLPYDNWANRVAVHAFVEDIPMGPDHPSWLTLCGVADGIAQFHSHRALIIWGGQDFCFNDRFYEEWRERLPRAETFYLDDAGHYVLDDARGDAVPRATEFLLSAD